MQTRWLVAACLTQCSFGLLLKLLGCNDISDQPSNQMLMQTSAVWSDRRGNSSHRACPDKPYLWKSHACVPAHLAKIKNSCQVNLISFKFDLSKHCTPRCRRCLVLCTLNGAGAHLRTSAASRRGEAGRRHCEANSPVQPPSHLPSNHQLSIVA